MTDPGLALFDGGPQQAVIVYQPMFAIITSALIPGVFGEQMKFSGILSASKQK